MDIFFVAAGPRYVRRRPGTTAVTAYPPALLLAASRASSITSASMSSMCSPISRAVAAVLGPLPVLPRQHQKAPRCRPTHRPECPRASASLTRILPQRIYVCCHVAFASCRLHRPCLPTKLTRFPPARCGCTRSSMTASASSPASQTESACSVLPPFAQGTTHSLSRSAGALHIKFH